MLRDLLMHAMLSGAVHARSCRAFLHLSHAVYAVLTIPLPIDAERIARAEEDYLNTNNKRFAAPFVKKGAHGHDDGHH